MGVSDNNPVTRQTTISKDTNERKKSDFGKFQKSFIEGRSTVKITPKTKGRSGRTRSFISGREKATRITERERVNIELKAQQNNRIEERKQNISVEQTRSAKINNLAARTISEPTVKPSITPEINTEVIAAQESNLSFQSTRTDLGDKLKFGEEIKDEGGVGPSFFEEDPRSPFEISTQQIGEKIVNKEDLTTKEIGLLPLVTAVEGGRFIGDIVKGFVKAPFKIVKSLTIDIDKTSESITDIITGKTKPRDILTGAEQQFRSNPGEFIGGTIFGVAGGRIIGGGFSKVKDVVVRAGATKIPPEKVFSAEVLSGEKTFPLTGSTAESIKAFDKADGVVQTSAPSKISGGVAGPGRKGAVDLEDPGIFVTPEGSGSPAFLGLGKPEFDLFPSSPLQSVKSIFDVPTVTKFKTRGVRKIPREVINKPGFKPIKEFFENREQTGEVFITKRSELGQGEISRQKFISSEDFTSPGGLNVKKGDVRFEAGTSELEAVIPLGQKFEGVSPKANLISRIKGFEKFTEFEGRPVAIREATLISDTAIKSGLFNPSSTRLVSGKKLLEESKSLSSPPPRIGTTQPSSIFNTPSDNSITGSIPSFETPGLESDNVDISTSGVSSSDLSRGFVPPSSVEPSIVVPSKVLSSSEPSTVSSGKSIRGSRSSVKPTVSKSISLLTDSSVSKSVPVKTTKQSSSISSFSKSRLLSTPITSKPTPIVSKIHRRREQPSKKSFFTVIIGSTGRKIFIKEKASSLFEAIRKGRAKLKGSAAASFEIRKNGILINKQEEDVVSDFLGREFRKGQKKGRFVQKRRFRISSEGEKKDITLEGIKARKQKGRFNSIAISKRGGSRLNSLVGEGFKLRDLRKLI